MNLVSETVVALLEEERFYAELILGMTRVMSKEVPIVGVCIRSNIELHINPDTFGKLPLAERIGVLRHECEHIFRDHIARAKQICPEIKDSKNIDPRTYGKFMRFNVAADMAINCMIPDIPKEGVFPKDFDLPNGETMEWYFDKLQDNKKANESFAFDSHELWHKSEGTEEIVKEKIRQAVNQAANKARSAGRLSAEHELLIAQLNKSKVDWRSELRRFVANTIETVRTSSRKKRNRRYGILIPGDVKEEVLHLGVAMDTSGSMSDAAITQIMSELHKMSKYAKISVVEADSEIKNAYLFDPKKKYKIKGRGGTAYKPVFDYFNDHDEPIDGLIYFGDMDCCDQEELKKPRYPVLWAINGGQNPPVKFGSRIRITVEGEE